MEYCLEVSGPFACFTDLKPERVSYPVITPSAITGIFESIYWKPPVYWQPSKIELLSEINWFSIKRNELTKTMSSDRSIFIEENRTQKFSLILRDVKYRIYAKLIYNKNIDNFDFSRADETEIKHNEIFKRRAEKGQCFRQPYFGCKEYVANFSLVEKPNSPPLNKDNDFGFMLYGINHNTQIKKPMYYHAMMKNGIIEIPEINSNKVYK